MRFRNIINRSSSTLAQIYEHPFNQQLYLGTLPSQKFRSYLEQDELYLRDFSLALSLVSNRCKNDRHTQHFKQFSEDILKTERKVHLKYLSGSVASRFFSENKARRKIPVIADYTAHLLRHAKEASIEEAVASLVACYLAFRGMGEIYKKRGWEENLSNHPYRDWINSYLSPRFVSSTELILDIIEELIKNNFSSQMEERVFLSLDQSVKFELHFLDEIFLAKVIVNPNLRKWLLIGVGSPHETYAKQYLYDL